MAGIALVALGVACWPGPPLLGMLSHTNGGDRAHLFRQHRLAGSPFVVGKFIAHDSKVPQFGSLNHRRAAFLNAASAVQFHRCRACVDWRYRCAELTLTGFAACAEVDAVALSDRG